MSASKISMQRPHGRRAPAQPAPTRGWGGGLTNMWRRLRRLFAAGDEPQAVPARRPALATAPERAFETRQASSTFTVAPPTIAPAARSDDAEAMAARPAATQVAARAPQRSQSVLVARATVAFAPPVSRPAPQPAKFAPAIKTAPTPCARKTPAPARLRPPPRRPQRFDAFVAGEGENVLFIPGLASGQQSFAAAAAFARGRARVHVLGVHGFAGLPAGRNARGPVLEPLAEEMAAYIRHACPEGVRIVGHSMGGLLALMLSLRAPDLVRGAMVVDALPWFGAVFGPYATPAIVDMQAAVLSEQIAAQHRLQFSLLQPFAMAPMMGATGEAARAVIKEAADSDPRMVGRAFYEIFSADLREAVGDIACPLTALYPAGLAGGFGPPGYMDAIFESAYRPVRDKRLIAVENTRHYIQIDQPELFRRRLAEFLGQPEGAALETVLQAS